MGRDIIYFSYCYDYNLKGLKVNNMYLGYIKLDRILVIVNCGGKKK